MNAADFDYLSSFLLKSSGLALSAGKEYLLEARLVPLSQQLGLNGFDELVAELRRGRNPEIATAVTEAMTTNETSFFRDKTPFEDLKKTVLPKLISARSSQRSLRIWCAASSSGQEPYSLLMLIEDHFPELRTWNFNFVATDISAGMLARSTAGIYSQFEVQRGLPIQQLIKHFEQCPTGWRVKDSLRQRVKFQKLNLLDPFTSIGPCDLVMCRNVLIYFDTPAKAKILERIRGITRNDGYLMLGAAETLLGISQAFLRHKECASAVYQATTPGQN